MNIKPLFDKVVIKPLIQEETKTIGGILLKAKEEKPTIAEVVAVGPGGRIDDIEITMQVKVGDKVIYSKYSGTEFKFENEDYTILRQSDILAKID